MNCVRYLIGQGLSFCGHNESLGSLNMGTSVRSLNGIKAVGLIENMEDFKFLFILELMIRLLVITNELSHVLQSKDLNIVHAMELVKDVKDHLLSI
jgi:hypothetical protein